MAGIIYTVRSTFPDAATVERWLAWLRGGHVADVIAGGATQADILRIDGVGFIYEVRYRFPSRELFDRYLVEHAPRLRADGAKLFPPEAGVVSERIVGAVLTTMP